MGETDEGEERGREEKPFDFAYNTQVQEPYLYYSQQHERKQVILGGKGKKVV